MVIAKQFLLLLLSPGRRNMQLLVINFSSTYVYRVQFLLLLHNIIDGIMSIKLNVKNAYSMFHYSIFPVLLLHEEDLSVPWVLSCN